MKKIRDTVFNILSILFSVALIVLCLLNHTELTRLKSKTEKLEHDAQLLCTENRILEAEIQYSLSIHELERRARELGMQSCSPGQIIYIDGGGLRD